MDYLTFMKYFSLVLLVGQNTVLVLLMRYTRTQSGDMYAASTAVCVMEVRELVHKMCGGCCVSVLMGSWLLWLVSVPRCSSSSLASASCSR